MTNEEAILYLQGYKATSNSAQVHTAMDMAIQALEKQIPKKPNKKEVAHVETLYTCPTCNAHIEKWQIICGECSQLVDWKEDADA